MFWKKNGHPKKNGGKNLLPNELTACFWSRAAHWLRPESKQWLLHHPRNLHLKPFPHFFLKIPPLKTNLTNWKIPHFKVDVQASHVVLFWVVLVVFWWSVSLDFALTWSFKQRYLVWQTKWLLGTQVILQEISGRLSKLTKTFHGNYH